MKKGIIIATFVLLFTVLAITVKSADRIVWLPDLLTGSTVESVDTHLNYSGKHREINDSGTASTDLWSANKINYEVTHIDGAAQIDNDTITPVKLDADLTPGSGVDGFVWTYNDATRKFAYEDVSGVVGNDTYRVRWDAGDAAEFLDQKLPNPDTGSGTELYKVNSGATAIVLGPTFEDPDASDDVGKHVVVNATYNGFELDSSTYLPTIAANTTYYVDNDGSDVTGIGSAGNPWYSISKAMTELADVRISPKVFVTISIADGTFSGLSAVTINHPDANRIKILGSGTNSLTFTASQGGITVAGVDLAQLSNVNLVGDSTEPGLYITSGGSIQVGSNITLNSWDIGLKIDKSSYANISSIDINGADTQGIVCTASTLVVTGTVDGIGSSGDGISSYNNCYIDLGLSMAVTGFNTCYYAQTVGFINASNSTATSCAINTYSPDVTTNFSSAVNYSPGGGVIYKP